MLFFSLINLQVVKLLHYDMENFESNRIIAICRKALRGNRQQPLPLQQTPCLQVHLVIFYIYLRVVYLPACCNWQQRAVYAIFRLPDC